MRATFLVSTLLAYAFLMAQSVSAELTERAINSASHSDWTSKTARRMLPILLSSKSRSSGPRSLFTRR